ncbi:ABC transporter permease [Runella sp. SP2]|uniref:ABC transporter permease n=1 Tax=Runella sp. SP2 TaxID=2268026 RepID=UPI000F097853|nr:FtsX-like permease family protein [Runella sp. SP2]AYQ32635.1 ABC transporter permease [Runella sp. SP2]
MNNNISWLLKMAWRDSRRNYSRLLLFVSSIVLGIAALVAIYSLGYNLRENIDSQAAELLGADLELSDNQTPNDKMQALMDSLKGQKSKEMSFASMIYFPKNSGTRLAQIRALEGDFPYYGTLETEPLAAAKEFRTQQAALVDQTLMLQYQAQVGDSIKVGEMTFKIAGILKKAPGQTGIAATVAPSVYIPLSFLEKTKLAQKGSRIVYRYYYKFAPKTNIEALVKKIEPKLENENYNFRTVESQKEDTGRSFRDLTRFLSLVGFIALLLGCVGVASAIHIYIREKINSIAILRCLGVKASQAFLIYLIQISGIGLLGSLLGAALGAGIQQFLPLVLKDFLPFELATSLSFTAIGQGVLLGVIISNLFALLSLISIRKISPLNVLRASYEQSGLGKDPLKWLVYALILAFVFGFTWLQMKRWTDAVAFTVGVTFAFLLLLGMATLLMWLVRRFFPSSWSYLSRQGLANLYRPNNQTAILMVSIGLGTMFICTLLFVQNLLLDRIKLSTDGDQPNMVLFDIQTPQKQAVMEVVKSQKLPILQNVPIVTMRLEQLNGQTSTEALKDTTNKRWRGLFSREYRVTFRDSLISTEKVVKGKWISEVKDVSQPVPISLEDGYAERNTINIGDTLLFNVQGMMLTTVVASLRDVDWAGVQTNFLVLFPKGVLEEAPQFHVLLTHVPNTTVSAQFQQAMVRQFPNVSMVDLGLILTVLDDISTKIGFVIRFMAGFSILTGLIVLIASVLISKYQRIQESILLRTLGASRRQILIITALEYLFLGTLAAFTGILLALVGSWALATFSFEMTFNPVLWPVGVVFLTVTFLTVFIGLANSWGILSRSPLEVLRQDV